MPPFRATPRPPGESAEARMVRKATDMRAAFIEFGLVVSPDPHLTLSDLPAFRQEKWLNLAREYVRIFG